jgi:hypothetical protein
MTLSHSSYFRRVLVVVLVFSLVLLIALIYVLSLDESRSARWKKYSVWGTNSLGSAGFTSSTLLNTESKPFIPANPSKGGTDKLGNAASLDLGKAANDRIQELVKMLPQQDPTSRFSSDFEPGELPIGMLEYLAWHQSQIENPSNDTKYIIYMCTGFCGGLGDRLRGIITLFYYCITTKKMFGIHWAKPLMLQGVIQPAMMDWITPSNTCFNESGGRMNIIDTDWRSFQYSMRLEVHRSAPAGLFSDPSKKCAWIHTNAMYFHIHMWELGLRESLGLPPSSHLDYPLVTWGLHALFKLSSELRNAYERELKKLGMEQKQPYVAMHVRLGSHAVGFSDGERHSIHELSLFSSCATSMKSYLEQRFNTRDVPVFIATDSNIAKDQISRQVTNTKYFPQAAFHVDRNPSVFGMDKVEQNHIRTWVEFLFLIRSECMIASRSGFSYIPLFWSSFTKPERRCWSWYHICQNTTHDDRNRNSVWNTGDSKLFPRNESIPWYVNNRLIIIPNGFSDMYGHVG